MKPRPHIDADQRRLIWGRLIDPPRIDPERCRGCGTCAATCSAHVFEVRQKQSQVVPDALCFGCGQCWAVCPERAVTQAESSALDAPDYAPDPPLRAEALDTFLGQRRSVRAFRSKPVPRDVLQRVAAAARHAPTGGNKQNVEIVVVADPTGVDTLRRQTERFVAGLARKLDNPIFARLFRWKTSAETLAQMRMYAMRYQWLQDNDRPSPYFPLPFGTAVMVAHATEADSTAGFNCITALHTSALAAQAEGLGCCYLGFVMAGANLDPAMKSWLGIPKGNRCHSAMVLGYPKVRYRRPVRRQGLRVTWL